VQGHAAVSADPDAGVAHFAHLGGMLGAFLMLRHYRASAA
jgi:membrane associated rhomboid family serine protease